MALLEPCAALGSQLANLEARREAVAKLAVVVTNLFCTVCFSLAAHGDFFVPPSHTSQSVASAGGPLGVSAV